ncbi:hypothetical protein [Brevundimonas sp.]|uniref:hypothetical protein n=1 Tax=Brevundimonas sp. TaxID=1871086 RepID=UPI003565DD08
MTRTRISSLAIAGLLAALASGPVAAQTAPPAANAHAAHAAAAQAAPEAPATNMSACHSMAGVDHSSMTSEQRAAMMERHRTMMATHGAASADGAGMAGMAGMDHSSMTPEQRAAMMERRQTMMAGMDHSNMSSEERAAMKAKHEAMMAACAGGLAGMDHGANDPAPAAAAEPAHQH